MKKYFQVYKSALGKFALNYELTQDEANMLLNNRPQKLNLKVAVI